MARTLQQHLDRISEGFAKQAPPEALAITKRAVEELRASGSLAHVVQEGQTAPDFDLAGSRGERVHLSALLQRGPLVLSFFRGHW